MTSGSESGTDDCESKKGGDVWFTLPGSVGPKVYSTAIAFDPTGQYMTDAPGQKSLGK